jgi:branched-subunit amino acid aminotransferase/4-amino-4-deoxychorismate lyase
LERPVAPAELMAAQAVFLTNSLRFIRPVTALDGLPLRTRDLGPLIDTLCDLAKQHCGRDPRLI